MTTIVWKNLCQEKCVLIYTKGFGYQEVSVTAAILKEPNRTHPGTAQTQTVNSVSVIGRSVHKKDILDVSKANLIVKGQNKL